MWTPVQQNLVNASRSASPLPLLAVALTAPGCADWPRFSHLPEPGFADADGIPVQAGILTEAEGADWGDNALRAPEDPVTIDRATSGFVELNELTPYEFVTVEGALSPFGGVDSVVDLPAFQCGQPEASTVRGRYLGDLDFLFLHLPQEHPFELLCAFLTVECERSVGEEPALDLVAYRVSSPSPQCDFLDPQQSFLSLPVQDQPDQPAWTHTGSYTPIDVVGSENVLLYVAGVSGCMPGEARYQIRLVPARRDLRCIELNEAL